MLGGTLIALLVSMLWIGVQMIWMHIRPAPNRFRSMLRGYLVSLPLVPLLWWILPSLAPELWLEWNGVEAPLSALFHALLAHLLIFFCYVEGFYHVERAVTLRLLIEILEFPGGQPTLRDIEKDYNIDEMVRRRLEVLAANGYVAREGDRWRLRPKGALLARIMALSCWIFQSKTQDERL